MSERREWISPAMLWACAALIVLSLVLWVVSSVRGYAVMHRAASGVRASATDAAWFEIDIRTRQVTVLNGRLIVSSEVYTSGAPDRVMLEKQWAAEVGWEWRDLGGQVYGPPWWSWIENQKIVLGAGGAMQWGSGEMFTTAVVYVPFWMTALAGAVPLLVYFSPGRRRARRRAQGLCAFCGYARVGLGPTQACPECGRADAQSAAKQAS